MSNLGYGGKTHVLPPCVFATFLVLSNLFIACFVSWGVIAEWLLVVEAVIVFGSGVAGLSVPCPCTHSTHDCIHSSLPCFPTFTGGRGVRPFCPWSVLPHAGLGLFRSHAETGSASSCAPLFCSSTCLDHCPFRLTQRDVLFTLAQAGILVLCSSCTSRGSCLIVHTASR